jgi:predicted small lipoprotein YifL
MLFSEAMQPILRTVLLIALVFGALSACTEAPSWQKLLASKIKEHYPSYDVQATPDGTLKVLRPNLPDARVNVEEIAQLCQRGPKDCNYATDQMLLELQSR